MKLYLLISVLFVKAIQHSDTKPTIEHESLHNQQKELLKQKELQVSVGGNIVLTPQEEKANRILMSYKIKELDVMFNNPEQFYLKHQFLNYKDKLSSSNVYKIIRMMPKGGSLHIHSSMLLNPEGLVELTYEDNLYACLERKKVKFNMTTEFPQGSCSTKWISLKDHRKYSVKNVKDFDDNLKKLFMFQIDDKMDINKRWQEFEASHDNFATLLAYRPIYEKYLHRVLEHFYSDNVRYMEIRGSMDSLYEIDGTKRGSDYILELVKNVTDTFIESHPDFFGVRIIITNNRGNVGKTRKNLLKTAELIRKYPDLVVGFDIVGQEEKGKPIAMYSTLFNYMKDYINYYFHAGETNWYGTDADNNLFDSIILGTKRIGHAFALVKHPILMSLVEQKEIAIEVNVISNSVLGLVDDLRNHPAAQFIASGLPIVICSDDPAVWGADPASHDYFVTFMAVASRWADLRMLKQLVLNTIKHSALDNVIKEVFYRSFEKDWSLFIERIIRNYNECVL